MERKIGIDHRENPTVTSGELKKFQPKNLPIGDFSMVGKNLIIDNKDEADLRKNLLERTHIISQIKNMEANYEKSVIIISNCNKLNFSGQDEHRYLGSLASLVIRSRTSFVPVQNYSQVLYIAQRMFEKSEDDKELTAPTRIQPSAETRQIASLCAIQGIKDNLAKRLLAEFKTLQNIANANMKDLMGVEGIGEGKALNIYTHFREQQK